VRTWDLINQGSSFVDLATNENVFKVVSLILGKDFVLGSLRCKKWPLPGHAYAPVTCILSSNRGHSQQPGHAPALSLPF
jgi:hypothetical protein